MPAVLSQRRPCNCRFCKYAAPRVVNEEIRSDEVALPRRGSPLPWLLLAVTVAGGSGIFVMARVRLTEERVRTAAALKANDEVMGRLRSVASEYAKSQITMTELEARKGVLEKQVLELDEKSKSQAAELRDLRKKK